MDKSELKELTLRFQNELEENKIENFLQKNPRGIFVIRLSLGLSQKDFIQRIENKISQVALIKHEKGRSSRMNSQLLRELLNHIPKHIDLDKIIENYEKFQSMKSGEHMTSERARELHHIWKKKTTKRQRQEWGKSGALKTNSSARLTKQEKQVKSVLDKLKLEYKIHYQMKTNILDMNIDFVLFDDYKPKFFIEATKRKHDLSILCQAYAYRCRLIKEAYPKIKAGIIIDGLPDSSRKIIENEFDFILNSKEIQNLSEFL